VEIIVNHEMFSERTGINLVSDRHASMIAFPSVSCMLWLQMCYVTCVSDGDVKRVSVGKMAKTSILWLSGVLLAASVPSLSYAASCAALDPGQQAKVDSFKLAPASILLQSDAAGSTLEADIGVIVSGDTDTLTSVTQLIKTANDTAKPAFARGLARAVQSCQQINPLEAFKIQREVLAVGDSAFVTAFLQATTNIAVADIGGGIGAGIGTGAGDESQGTHKGTPGQPTGGGLTNPILVNAMGALTFGDNNTSANSTTSP